MVSAALQSDERKGSAEVICSGEGKVGGEDNGYVVLADAVSERASRA
jgi:hypothetical protein